MAGYRLAFEVLPCIYSLFLFAVSITNGESGRLKFNVVADWGGLPDFPYRTLIEAAVASRLGKISAQFGSQFTLALGDNFYFDGVKNEFDPRFNETFESVFTNPSLQNPWYFLAGNHDHNGNVSAQIAYSKHSKRWNYPNYYYNLTFPIPDTNMSVEFVLIDTVILCGNTDSDFSLEAPRGPHNKDAAEVQWDWIAKTLGDSKADYLIVVGHYPVWSIAEHGPTTCLVDRLMPMFMKYHVTGYFCGHDHNLQHFQYSLTTWMTDYFVVGAANFIDTSVAHENSVPSGSLKYHWANPLGLGGFGFVEASSDNMTFTFIEASGKTLYQQPMPPRPMINH